MALILTGSFVIDTPRAYAASYNSLAQVETAKKIISDVAPSITQAAEKNAEVNKLSTAPDGFLAKPLLTETSVTPAYKPIIKPKTIATTYRAISKTALGSNDFPYGYCTYYVASQRSITWRGNAGTWLSGARAAGLATGSVPKVGSIVVTSESKVGHVGMVTSVDGDLVTITEMNYHGFGVISSRTISASYGVIKGYIY